MNQGDANFISPVRLPDRSLIHEPTDIFSPSSTQIRQQLKQHASNSPQISISDVEAFKHSAVELEGAGCTCADLRLHGLTVLQLVAIGYSLADLRTAGFSISEIAAHGYSYSQLAEAGFAAEDLRDAGCSLAQFLQIKGFDLKEIYPLFTLPELHAGGVAVAQLAALRKPELSVSFLRKAGYSSQEILASEAFDVYSLKAGGFTAQDLIYAGTTPDELLQLGLSIHQLIAMRKWTAVDLYNAGATLSDLRLAGYTIADLHASKFPLTDIRKCGFTISEFLTSGLFFLYEIRDAGFDAKAFSSVHVPAPDIASFFKLGELKLAGYGSIDLRGAGFSLEELISVGFGASDLKDAGFTASELRGQNFTIFQLKSARFELADLRLAGFSNSQLKSVGF